jgi:predicted metal-dependent hydrolase
MATINIKGKQFTYFIKRKPIRSINLRLISSDSFYISCPRATPAFSLNHFLKNHLDWIYKNSQKLTIYPKLKKLTSLDILDQKYLVRIIQKDRQIIIFDHKFKFIKIFVKKITQKNLDKLIQKYFKPLAKILIKKEIKKIGNFSKLKKISVRNQKTRFGSCSGKGHLSFNWQIIFFPKEKFKHIICHELVHLKIKNHKKDYYLSLSKLDPDWRVNNRWLKTDAKKHFLIKP